MATESQAIVPVQTITIPMPPVPSTSTIQALDLLSQKVAGSNMSKFKKSSDALFVMLYGLELGIPPMTALRGLYSIGGVPATSGEMLLALIRRSGKVQVKISSTEEILANKRCVVWMKRLDSGDEYTASFGAEDAERAGITASNANYKKYPHAMYMWRAVSIGGKALCSDIVGALYTVEEISPDTLVDENGTPIGDIVDAEYTDVTPAGTWANGNLDKLRDAIHNILKVNASDSEIARLAGIGAFNDVAAWNAKYESGKAAAAAIETAFNIELASTPPAQPKQTQPQDPSPTPFTWTDFDIHAHEEEIKDLYPLTGEEALKLVGHETWSVYADRAAAKEAVRQAVVQSNTHMFATKATVKPGGNGGKYLELHTATPIRCYGRDKFKKAFEFSPELLAAVETWTEVGKTYEFPLVEIKWTQANSYLNTEDITLYIPF